MLRKILGTISAVVAILLASATCYVSWWYFVRNDPLDRELWPDLRHVRIITSAPRPVVVNLVFVDLTNNIQFEVSKPASATHPRMKATTVKAFLQQRELHLAMNANFFHPFHSNSPWDYYPHSADPVDVLGIAASNGDLYSTQIWAGATLYVSQMNEVHFGGMVTNVWNAIAGDQWLIREGLVVAKEDSFGIYPRAAIAADATGRTLILAVVDGKQPGFSEGMSLPELAELLRSRGAYHAINLDGGGSVTLVARDKSGKAVALNSPIHTRIPGRQRPVANQFGIRVAGH